VQSASGISTTSFGYDANGSQISQTTGSGTQASKWDFEGHLLAQGGVDANGNWAGNRTGYNYDASGMRLTQAAFDASGTLTKGTSYVWNGDRVAEERDEKGVLQGVYEHGQELGPLRLRRLKDGAWQNRFFVGDGQDSTRQLMNEAGVVTDSYFYDSFGNGLNGGQGQTINPFKYAGQQQDESGLYYLRARYYNAGTGRFLSHDPLMGSGSDPISMHRYLYAGDDPANNVDPSGEDYSLSGLAVTGAIIGSIGGALHTAANGGTPLQIVGGAFVGAGIGAVLPVIAAGSFALAGSSSALLAVTGTLLTSGIVAGGGIGLASGIYEDIETLGSPAPAWRKVLASVDIAYAGAISILPFTSAGEALSAQGEAIAGRITNRIVNARSAPAVAFAKSQQGTYPYNFVDPFTGNVNLEGDILWQLTYDGKTNTTPFFTTTETIEAAGGSAQKLSSLLQTRNDKSIHPVTGKPDPPPYSTANLKLQAYRVTRKIHDAIGTVQANNHHGDGGGTQVVLTKDQISSGAVEEIPGKVIDLN